MSLTLPAKNAPATAANVHALEAGLTSVIAGHPQSIQPWTFYEELDNYLGPWGNSGYPINYGKFYCIAFNGNEKLRRNPQTADWVRRTTIALQEPLRDVVVERFRKGTLAALTEPELRSYAFDCHPTAYTRGGLGMVALAAPELLPVIASIPSREFVPWSGNFFATVWQVLVTVGLIAPGVVGNALGAVAGPAHNGILQRAAQQGGMNQILQFQAQVRALDEIRQRIESGGADDMNALNLITSTMNATAQPDQGFAAMARQVVAAADARKHYVANSYRQYIRLHPLLQAQLDRSEPGWSDW